MKNNINICRKCWYAEWSKGYPYTNYSCVIDCKKNHDIFNKDNDCDDYIDMVEELKKQLGE